MAEGLRKTRKVGTGNVRGGNSDLELRTGRIINKRYRIIKKVGSGGFGTVFRATDTLLNKDVALKFLDPEISNNKKKIIRVKREINTSQKISDERVVKIFGIDYMRNTPFIIMEFIEGINLKLFIKKREFSQWGEFKPVFLEILKGIKSLHDKKIIHRDIKPSNIIITPDGNVKIIDFGLSKELGDTEKTSSIGEMIGSPKYMSPEQIRGEELDEASDIYQLGLILYYFLNRGEDDERDNSTIQQLMDRINSNPRKYYVLNPEISRFLKFGIYKSLESDKEFRFKSVTEMIDYFSYEKVHMLTLISNYFKRNVKRVFILGIVVVLIGTISFVYLKESRIMSEVNISGSEMVVTNKYGFNLIKKDFAPMKVINAIPLKINSDFRRLRQRFDKDNYLKKALPVTAVFLSKDNLYREIVNLSIKSEKFSSKVSLLNSYGDRIYTHIFHLKNDHLQSALFSGWMDFGNIGSNDLDGDGENEIHFFAFQNMSMFPSAFCILDKQDFHTVHNKGHIEKFLFYKGKKNEKRVLLVGMSNLFCHFKFICDYDFDKTSNIQLPPFLNKNLNRFVPKFSYMLIPYRTEIIKNNWSNGGSIIIKSLSNSDMYELNKNWELSITKEGKVTVYKDNSQDISDLLYFLSLAYQKKILKQGAINSFGDIDQALELNISNPVFRSLVYFYAGEMNMSLGNHNEAEKYFNISKKIFPDNPDLDQKFAELYFLSGNNEKLKGLLERKSIGYSRFFGLAKFGIQMFKVYYFLNTGEFRYASDLSGGYRKDDNYLKGMISLFKGDYTKALSKSSRLIGNRTTPFTLSEARLLYSRSVLLNYIIRGKSDSIDNEDVKLADFYFSDISLNSILDGHLAAMSRAYFMALNGDKKDAEEYAVETFEKLVKDSKGDMFTRFWLFYDTYIYGKTMEILDNKEEAIRGYNFSIRSNPYTELAKRSKKNLSRLIKKQIPMHSVPISGQRIN